MFTDLARTKFHHHETFNWAQNDAAKKVQKEKHLCHVFHVTANSVD